MNCPTCNKPTPADSVHTCSPVPLLTAHEAKHLYDTIDYTRGAYQQVALKAIATGRAVVVPRMSEAEAREKYHRWVGTGDTLYGQRAYLGALRDLGVLRD